MQIEVYQQTKPPPPGRALTVTILLLVVTTGLAARMSGGRRAEPLGDRVELAEAGLSVRPPDGFVPAATFTVDDWRVQVFDGSDSEWAPAELAVWRASGHPPVDVNAAAFELLQRVLNSKSGVAGTASVIPRLNVVIASRPATELMDPGSGIVVRVARARVGLLAVTFSSDAPLKQWYTTFDAVCEAVELSP